MIILTFLSTNTGNGQSSGINNIYMQNDVNIIPTTPQASALGSFSNRGINGATGTPIITVPIYTLEEDGVSLPIYLSYDASGIRLEDISTEVGLKWNLNFGGAVSRVIRGLPDDDFQGGWFNYSGNGFPETSWNNQMHCYQQKMEDIVNNFVDVIPDLFSYTIGDKTNTFFFQKDRTIKKTIADDIKLVANWYKNNDKYTIAGFTLTDNMGIEYTYYNYNATTAIQTTISASSNPSFPTNGQPRTGEGVVEWKLEKITTRNNKTIKFKYISHSIEYTMQNNQTRRYRGTQSSLISYNTKYTINTWLPDEIYTDNILIKFNYGTENNAYVWKKKLTGITITFKDTGYQKNFTLNYGTYNGCAKLKLNEIIEGTDGTNNIKKWQFKYETSQIPDMNGKNFDFYGYCNGTGYQTYVTCSYNTSNATFGVINSRDVNNQHVAKGILNEIIYPTGGKTKYYYEANIENVNNVKYFAPGVRVYEIEDIDENNNICKTTKYVYSGLKGNYHRADDYGLYGITYTDGSVVLFTFPFDNFNTISGHCYETVEIQHHKNNTCKFKEIEKYSPYKVNLRLHPKLMEKNYYDENNNPVSKTSYYIHSPYSIGKTYGWKVSSDCIPAGMHYADCNSGNYNAAGPYYYGVYKNYVCESTQNSYLYMFITNYEYSDNGTITDVQEFEYNEELQLTKYKKYLTDQLSHSEYHFFETEYTYPKANNNSTLYNKHITGLPLTETVSYFYTESIFWGYEHGQEIWQLKHHSFVNDKKKYDYDSNGNIIKLYDFVNDETVNYITLNSEYSYYSNGKIKEIKHLDGTYTTYLWSYKWKYPVAEIKNASYNEVKQKITEETITTIATSVTPTSNHLTLIKNLQTSLPNALVTVFTHKPLNGISSITNPDGITTYYDYDAFGNLNEISIGENGGNTVRKIESYKYNYKIK